jgi:tetratricopeptide (TPR) repeat protein
MSHPLHAKNNSTLRRFARLTALAAALSFANHAAWADEYSDVSRLLRANQLGEALAKADQYLASKPRDPQMRFLKGVIQTEAGKTNDAIGTFTKLTEDYPELPEPYNNLAVLYAGQSQFDKARASLEMAIRTNPSYATAHENLGDVYAKLASQAYSKALQLDGNNTGVQPKLALIRDLFAPTKGTAAAKPTAAAPVPAPAAKPPVVAAAPAPAPTPAAAPKPAASAPVPAPAPAPAPAAPTANANDQNEARSAVLAWAEAWSRKDLSAYFGAYGKDFSPAGGLSRAKWEEDRKARILGKSRISVKLSNINIDVKGNRATARFRQDYSADALAISSGKTLELQKAGERWVIVREASGG